MKNRVLIMLLVFCFSLTAIPVFGLDELKAPTNLWSETISHSSIQIRWDDNSSNESGFKIEMKGFGENYVLLTTIGPNKNSFMVEGLTPDKMYSFRIKAFNSSSESMYSNETSSRTLIKPPQTILRFYANSEYYYVKEAAKTDFVIHKMDILPVIIQNRTMLPIKYISQHLGATTDWIANLQLVRLKFGKKEIETIIGKNYAIINGQSVSIDAQNPNVVPVIVPPGRTMLPLRFITENLGCSVEWNPANQEITITYPK